MKTCTNCLAVNPDEASFCDNCGSQLPVGAPPVPAVPAMPRAPAPPPTQAALSCPGCGRPVLAGQAFCDECGASLSAVAFHSPAPPIAPGLPPGAIEPRPPAPGGAPPPPYAPPPTALAPAMAAPGQPPAAAASTCSICGQPVTPGDAFCSACGAPVAVAPPPPPPPPPPLQPSPPPIPSSVATQPARLVVAGSGAQFELSGRTAFVIGRSDPISQAFPDIDLAPHGGEEAGVSRQHARLSAQAGSWAIEDLDSLNHTWVNNDQLAPKTPRALNNGDQIRLGRFPVTFHA